MDSSCSAKTPSKSAVPSASIEQFIHVIENPRHLSSRRRGYPRPSAADIDVAVISIVAEAVTPSLQFPIQIGQQDIGQQWRHQDVVVYPVKELLQIGIHYPAPAFFEVAAGLLYRLRGTPALSKAVTVGLGYLYLTHR